LSGTRYRSPFGKLTRSVSLLLSRRARDDGGNRSRFRLRDFPLSFSYLKAGVWTALGRSFHLQ